MIHTYNRTMRGLSTVLSFNIQNFLYVFFTCCIMVYFPSKILGKGIPNRAVLFYQNQFDNALGQVEQKLNILTGLLNQIKGFKTIAYGAEVHTINHFEHLVTTSKLEIETRLLQTKAVIQGLSGDPDALKKKEGEIFRLLQNFTIILDEQIVSSQRFIDEFKSHLINKKYVFTQIQNTDKIILQVYKQINSARRFMDVDGALNEYQCIRRIQHKGIKKYYSGRIKEALTKTLFARNKTYALSSILTSSTLRDTKIRRVRSFIERTEILLNKIKHQSSLNIPNYLIKIYVLAEEHQKRANATLIEDPDYAMQSAKDALAHANKVWMYYTQEKTTQNKIHNFENSIEQVQSDTPIVFLESDEVASPDNLKMGFQEEKKLSIKNIPPVSWHIATSGDVSYSTAAIDEYVALLENGEFGDNQDKATIDNLYGYGVFRTLMNWYPSMAIIDRIQPSIRLSNSDCKIGTDITMNFLKRMLTIHGIIDGTLMLDQEPTMFENTLFGLLELSLTKHVSNGSIAIGGEFQSEEFAHHRSGSMPYRKYQINSDFLFESNELNRSLNVGILYGFYDFDTYAIESLHRDYHYYRPSFHAQILNDGYSLHVDGHYLFEKFLQIPEKTGELFPSHSHNCFGEICLFNQSLNWLDITLPLSYTYFSPIIQYVTLIQSSMDTLSIPVENHYVHTFRCAPDFVLKPYSTIGLGLSFLGERQKYTVLPEFDTLHTLKSYYAFSQGMRLFYKKQDVLFQIAYTFRIEQSSEKGHYSECDYWQIQIPVEWYWKPLRWLSMRFLSEYRYRRKTIKKIQNKKSKERGVNISFSLDFTL